MGSFHTVAKVGDLGDGEGVAVEVNHFTVALFRVGGEYFAIDDHCPHMGASLSGGHVERGVVTCPWHGWRFRLNDGAWADSPRVKTRCFAVRVLGDDIQVEVPELPQTPPGPTNPVG
jgi:nitrite reductase (NADH) small subunit/3-phenylpropionate/trans-cinnamate dioxygenase ferredoxin subunit